MNNKSSIKLSLQTLNPGSHSSVTINCNDQDDPLFTNVPLRADVTSSSLNKLQQSQLHQNSFFQDITNSCETLKDKGQSNARKMNGGSPDKPDPELAALADMVFRRLEKLSFDESKSIQRNKIVEQKKNKLIISIMAIIFPVNQA